MEIKDSMRCEVNGISMNVVERGGSDSRLNRPALVFLHYFGGSSRAWSEVIARLEGEHFCVAPDLRGFGNTEAPPAGYAVSDYADDVVALVRLLSIERYILVGHSLGGKIALLVAARAAPGLESLVLLAPSTPTPEPMTETERARLLKSYGNRAASEETTRQTISLPLSQELHDQIIKDSLRASRLAWNAWLTEGSREDISAQMGNIRAPVLVMSGACDRAIPAHHLEREIVRCVPGTRLVIAPEAGHLLPLEVPTATAELIAKASAIRLDF